MGDGQTEMTSVSLRVKLSWLHWNFPQWKDCP